MAKKHSLDFIRALPKAELHIHLSGAYPLSYLQTIALDTDSIREYKNLVTGIKAIVNQQFSV